MAQKRPTQREELAHLRTENERLQALLTQIECEPRQAPPAPQMANPLMIQTLQHLPASIPPPARSSERANRPRQQWQSSRESGCIQKLTIAAMGAFFQSLFLYFALMMAIPNGVKLQSPWGMLSLIIFFSPGIFPIVLMCISERLDRRRSSTALTIQRTYKPKAPAERPRRSRQRANATEKAAATTILSAEARPRRITRKLLPAITQKLDEKGGA